MYSSSFQSWNTNRCLASIDDARAFGCRLPYEVRVAPKVKLYQVLNDYGKYQIYFMILGLIPDISIVSKWYWSSILQNGKVVVTVRQKKERRLCHF